MCSTIASSSGGEIVLFAGDPDPFHRPAGSGDRGDDRELDVQVRGIEVEEELIDLVDHLFGAGVGAIDLVEHQHSRQVQIQRLGQHVAGLGQRALGGIDQQEDPIHHCQRPLDLSAEVGMPGCVHQVDAGALPHHGRSLGEDRDATLSLLVGRIHDALDAGLVRSEYSGRAEHRIDQSRLAMVDVRDQRQISKGGTRHGPDNGTDLGLKPRRHDGFESVWPGYLPALQQRRKPCLLHC